MKQLDLGKIGLVLLVIYVVLLFILTPVSGPLVDSAYYADIAKNIASGSGFQANYAPAVHNPIFPYVIAAFMLVFGTLWAKAYTIISAVILLVSFYYLAREYLDEKESLLATGLFVFIPIVFYLSMEILSDSLFLIFTILATLFYVKLTKNSTAQNTILTIIAILLAIFTRNNGLLLPVVFAIHYAWISLKEKALNKKTLLPLALILLLSFGAFLGWSLATKASGAQDYGSRYLDRISNIPIMSSLSISLSDFENLTGNKAGVNAPLIINLNLPYFVSYAIRLVLYTVSIVGLVFVGLTAFKLLKSKLSKEELILLIFLLVFAAFHVFWPLAFSSRYVAPFAIPLVILGVSALRNIKAKNVILAFIAINLLLSSIAITYDVNTRWQNAKSASSVFEQTGTYLTVHASNDEKVTVSGMPLTVISYYSSRQAVLFENENTTITTNYLVSSNYLTKTPPTSPPGFSLCREFKEGQYFAQVFAKKC